MLYIESPSQDAFFNMALEEAVFEHLPRGEEYFMLWQNAGAVVVGKNQNTAREVNAAFVKEHGIQVVRRLSGGGAMYQDAGNLNFTFVVDQRGARNLDFSLFTGPVVRALAGFGVGAAATSRNDITVDGCKVSGNAQYNKDGRTMHHGTLLYDADLGMVAKVLTPPPDKFESKGVASVRSRVSNIARHMPEKVSMDAFKRGILREMFGTGEPARYALTEEDLAAVEALRRDKYAAYAWNWGRSPAYNTQKRRRYPFGEVQVWMQVKDGLLEDVHFSGDFFGNGDMEGLRQALCGCRLQPETLEKALRGVPVGYYVMGLDAETLAALLLY